MITTPALIAESLSREFGTHKAVDQADLRLESGQITALIGSSGSGKTTLLRMLAGMERPDSGRVLSGSEELSSAAKFVPIEKRRIGLVFQDFALFPHLNVLENVMFGLRNLPKQERREVAGDWIEKLGLGHRRDAYPHHLSGGEQQRTAIARALAPAPVAILLDEPFSGLDPAMRDQVRDAALEAVRAANIPALLVTHDASEALVHADQIAVIDSGKILQVGTPEDLYRKPINLKAARALGPVHQIETAALPHHWKSMFATTSDTLWYRPEALSILPGNAFSVLKTRLAGPVTELQLALGETDCLFAACQLGAPLQAGDQVNLSVNPSLFFDFSDETT